MNVLDENIADWQRETLRKWRIRAQHIGRGLGRPSIKDDEIIPLLHQLTRPTLFTCDARFYRRELCHAGYCLVRLDVEDGAVPEAIRRYLRHPRFTQWAQRRGTVAHVSPSGIRFWQLHAVAEEAVGWPE